MTLIIKRIALALATAAMLLVPALALAAKPETNPGNGHDKAPSPGPGASKKAKRKAHGKDCKGESRTHVKGETGTPYSRCIVAAAHVRNDHADDDDGGPTGPTA